MPSKPFHQKTVPGKTPAHVKGRRRGGGRLLFQRDPVMKQRSGRAAGSSGGVSAHSRAAPPRPVGGAGCNAQSLGEGLFFSERDGTEAALPGPGVRCPPSARKGKRGGRDAEMCISAAEPSLSCLSFSKQPVPHRLSTAFSGREGGLSASGELCTIKPLPRSYISNFFLSRSFILRTCATWQVHNLPFPATLVPFSGFGGSNFSAGF